jgi:hypothetical protein
MFGCRPFSIDTRIEKGEDAGRLSRDRELESGSLQRRVSCEPDICGFWGKSNQDRRDGLPGELGPRSKSAPRLGHKA